MIPAAPLEWFDAADQGIVLIFGDNGRHGTQTWLQERRAERGGRQLGLDEQDAADALRHARRWDIDTLFCSDFTEGRVFAAALEASADGALVVVNCQARDVVDGLTYLCSLVEPGMSGHCLELLSLHLRFAISERAVTRADGQGTVAAFEVLNVIRAQRNLIRENSIHRLPAQMAVPGRTNARWWPDALADLVLDGTCSFEAAEAAGHAPGEVKRALERADASSSPSHVAPGNDGEG